MGRLLLYNLQKNIIEMTNKHKVKWATVFVYETFTL